MKIKPEVLAMLSLVACEGDRAVIVGRLGRKSYVALNEVLEALGGKWSRKAKAHVFDGDAASLLDVAMVTGEVTTRREIGFFPTPAPLARELVEGLLDPRTGTVPSSRGYETATVLEPSAGTGAIVDALLEVRAAVVAVERDPKMRAALRDREGDTGRTSSALGRALVVAGLGASGYDDFLAFHYAALTGGIGAGLLDAAAMNPPFCKVGGGDHLDHVRRAFVLLRPEGRLRAILPASVEFRQDRRHSAFRTWVDGLGGRIEPLPPLSFRESGTDVSTCMLTLEAP